MAPGGMNILPGAFFWRYRDFENNNIRDYGNANFNDDHEISEYFRKPRQLFENALRVAGKSYWRS